jgi:hypothetical protein
VWQEEVEDVTWETHPGPLSSNQEKAREKVVKRREKIANLQKEIDAIQAKEIAQGGLTPGQQAQVQHGEKGRPLTTQWLAWLEKSNEWGEQTDGLSRTGGAKRREASAMVEDF